MSVVTELESRVIVSLSEISILFSILYKASSPPDSDKKYDFLEFKFTLAFLYSRTVGPTRPEIIAKEIKRKNTTDISIAAPLFLFFFLTFDFIFFNNFPLKQPCCKNLGLEPSCHCWNELREPLLP